MQVCMIATTPYQVLSCVSLAINNSWTVDLYLCNSFPNSQTICKKINELHIFRNVYAIDQFKIYDERNKGKLRKRIELITRYIRLKSVVETYIDTNNIYNMLFISNNAVICRLTYLYFYKYHPNTIINFYDDGIGSYCNKMIFSPSCIERLYQRLFVNVKFYTKHLNLYVYCPEMVSKKIASSFSKVLKIYSLSTIENIKEIFVNVFGVECEFISQEKLIILDSWKKAELYQAGIEKMERIYSRLVNDYHGNVIVKTHPKDSDNKYRYETINASGIPFEYFCCMTDLSNRIIVTNLSSAAFSPKLLFNQEPTIIFLYNIFYKDLIENDLHFIEISEYLKKAYSKEKVFIPKTIDEAVDIIKKEMGS